MGERLIRFIISLDNIKYPLFLILVCISFFIVGTYYHEEAHVAIYKSYGVDSTVEWKWWGAQTVAYPGDKCNDSCLMQHNLNEIITYNLNCVAMLIWGIAFVISMHFIDG